MPATLSALDAILKDDYQGPVREQLNNSNMFAAQVNQNTEDFEGRKFVIPGHFGRNKGVGARGEGGTIPTAGNQTYRDLFGPVRFLYASVRLTTAVIRSAQSNKGSFIRALESELKGAQTDASRDECRQTWGTSDGILATCGTTTASTTVVLAASTGQNQLRWILDRGQVDIGTAATPTSVASARDVVSVDFTAKTVTISGAAVTTSGTNFVYASGSGGASNNSGTYGDGQSELTGLQTMVASSGTVHTLSAATEPRWASRQYNAVGSISENAIVKAMNDVEIDSGEDVDLMVCAYGVWRAVGNLFTTLKQFVDNVELKGGYKGITFNAAMAGGKGSTKVAIVPCRDTPDGTLWGLNTGSFQYMTLQDWEWLDADGAVLSRATDGTAAYVATLEAMKEMVCTRRNANFVMKGITEA